MKLYKGCERCGESGCIDNTIDIIDCPVCEGTGYIETNPPIEEMIEALKKAKRQLPQLSSFPNIETQCGNDTKAVHEAIKAAEAWREETK